MKNVFLLCLLLAGGLIHAYAQTEPAAPTRELGVRFEGINLGGENSFSLVFKKQKSENKYRRWRAVFGSISANNSPSTVNAQMSLGLTYGLEKRKPLDEHLSFNHGFEFGGALALRFNDDFTNWYAALSAGYVLGVQYKLNKRFFVNLETIPGLNLRFADNSGNLENIQVGTDLGFNSTAALTLGILF